LRFRPTTKMKKQKMFWLPMGYVVLLKLSETEVGFLCLKVFYPVNKVVCLIYLSISCLPSYLHTYYKITSIDSDFIVCYKFCLYDCFFLLDY
jgi:hypothetical protein